MASRTGRPRAWWTYLACGAVVAAAYYLVPATDLAPRWAAKIGLYNGLGLSAVAAIAVGVAWHRPERPLTWYLFAVGLLSYVTADIIFYTTLLLLIRSRTPGPTGPASWTPWSSPSALACSPGCSWSARWPRRRD